MSATRKSRLILLSLSLAVAFLLGVFAIVFASSANASQSEVPGFQYNSPLSVVISPTQLYVELLPGEQVTESLWITNLGSIEINFDIQEITAELPLNGFTLLPVATPIIDPFIQSQISGDGSALAIIYLREQPELSPAYLISDKDLRARYVYDLLQETASHSQDLFSWLESHGARPHRLWIANAITAKLDIDMLKTLAVNPQVKEIVPNHQYQLISESPSPFIGPQLPAVPVNNPDLVEWNIAKIRADDAWTAFDVTGDGAVVGIVDTGVMYDHPALVGSYRGNLGDGTFDHNWNWFDFVDNSPVPVDPNGHGTMGAGVVSGDDGQGNQIGVAPGVDWIAVSACSAGGGCSEVDLLAALQWMLAPTRLDGTTPDPSKAPDVVLGMWGGGGCDTSYQFTLQILRAANILPIFPTGASGPGCGTVGSPAALPETFAAGATDSTDLIASFSSRGPSPCFGVLKPDVTAPGVGIRTSSTGSVDYTITSGTSWSAAHTAGAAAMVVSANPYLGVAEIEDILKDTALCLDNPSCGGTPCPDGANNVYGHGRIDVFDAVFAALSTLPHDDLLPWLVESPISGTLAPGEGIAIQVSFDSSGLEPGIYTGTLNILTNDDPPQANLKVPVTLSVTASCEPIDSLSASFVPDEPVAGEMITFTASATGTLPITYTWDFDDGNSAVGNEVTHIFDHPSTYTVTLVTENTCDLMDTFLIVKVLTPCQPVSDLTANFSPPGPLVGEVITFTASVTGSQPITFTWGFGDGEIAKGQEVTHVFTASGKHVVILIAENGCGVAVSQLDVVVIQQFWLPLALK